MKSRGSILDFAGSITEFKFGKKQLIGFIVTVIVTAVCALLPLESVSPDASKGLALLVCVLAIWFSGCLPQVVGSFILLIGTVLLGFGSAGDVLTEFGNSPFFQIAMFSIVAMGANRTKIGKRIAYFFLSKLGRTPSKILFALFISAAVISAFVSNLATTAVMIAIGTSILKALDETEGAGGFGKAMCILIPVGSMTGGLALISGSPGINSVAISALENATEGAYTVTYAQWAAIGIPFALIVIIPTVLIYAWWFKVDKQIKAGALDTSKFAEELADLGPISWAEIRWIITLVAMIVVFITTSLKMPIIACIFATITLLPGVGTVSVKDAMKDLPMGVLFLAGVTPLMGLIMTKCNIVSLLSGLFSWIPQVPLLVAMLLLGFITWLAQAVLLESWAAVIVIICSVAAPIAMANGINPAMLLYPSLSILSAQMVLGITGHMLLTYRYNYYKLYDTIVPGSLVSLVWLIVVTLLTYFIGPLVGMNVLV